MATVLERSDDRLLATPRQPATALAISRKTLDRLVADGHLRVVKLHGPRGHRRFRWADLRELATKEED